MLNSPLLTKYAFLLPDERVTKEREIYNKAIVDNNMYKTTLSQILALKLRISIWFFFILFLQHDAVDESDVVNLIFLGPSP